MLSITSAFAATAIAMASMYIISKAMTRRRPPLPPGPTPLPIVGNVHQIPTKEEHLIFQEWGKIYGRFFCLKAFSRPIIVINSYQVAADLLEKRGAKYADRPYIPMAGEIVGWDKGVGLMNGEPFRESRKMMHKVIEGQRAYNFINYIEAESQKMAIRMFKDPLEFRQHIRVASGAIIFMIAHGYTVDTRPYKDPFIQLYEVVMHDLSECFVPGRWWIDIFPLLKHIPDWFPGASFKREGKIFRDRLEQSVTLPHDWAVKEMKAGTAVPSCTQILLDNEEKLTAERENMIKWTTGAMLAGGADTSVSLISTFFLAMSLHPEVVAKAQTELDKIIGPDRLPTLKDRPQLPYVEAVMCEVMRYAPPSVLAAPHMATVDDTYEGYSIPKGSMMWANLWAMTKDPNIFLNPMEFNPERFLDASGKFDKSIKASNGNDPREIIFGFGRRICPGLDLAQLNMWSSMSTALHLFSITRPSSEPRISMAEAKFEAALLSHPAEFKCTIRPRSSNAEKLLRNLEQSHSIY